MRLSPDASRSSATSVLKGASRYGVAVAVVGIAAALRWALDPVVGTARPMTLFYPAVAIAAWLGGLGPGALAVLLGVAIAAAPLLARSAGTAELSGAGVRLALFALVAVLLALLVEAARRQGRRAAASARAANEVEQRWRSLLEYTGDSVAIAGRDGAIELVNRPPEWAPAQLPGASLYEHLASGQHELLRSALATVFEAGEPARFEAEARRPDGTARWVETRLVPIRDAAGGTQGALVLSSDVTERRRSEEALREIAAQFRSLFEASLDPTMVMDDEGRVVEANPAACALFELPPERLVGTGLWEFSGSRPAFDAGWARFLMDGQMLGERELHLPDGRLRHVELSARARVLPGRHLAVLRDVGERRRGQEAAELLGRATRVLAASLEERETARALAAVLVPEMADWCAVDVQDDAGELSRIALAAADTRREDLAWELTRCAPPDGLGGAALREVVRTGEPWLWPALGGEQPQALAHDPEHLRTLLASGLRSVMVVPLLSRGRPMGALWFAGIEGRPPFGSHELSLARELAERAGVALENARLYREAQQANRVKDEFLATLSHELRTPLNAIVGWTHLLRTGGLDAATSERALETIERNARLQSQLIADILDVSRIVSGKLRIESAPVDLGAVTAMAIDVVRPAAEAKGVRLVADATMRGATVLGDAGRLQQVAQNLLQNAVKFTEKGGEVRAGLRRSGHALELVVEDTGAGIAAELLPHIFERFRQGDSSTTRPHGGLGLGLAITRHLVEAHGGSVEAASRGSGQGATFTVRLPVVAGGAADEPRAVAGAPVKLAGIRVLVVGGASDGAQLASTLERAGASVSRVTTSSEALAAVQRFRPDVLLTGLGLPDEDGFALVTRVRSLPAHDGGTIPAVAVAAQAGPEEMARALRAGFQRHLALPVDPAELASVIAQLASQRADPRAGD